MESLGSLLLALSSFAQPLMQGSMLFGEGLWRRRNSELLGAFWVGLQVLVVLGKFWIKWKEFGPLYLLMVSRYHGFPERLIWLGRR